MALGFAWKTVVFFSCNSERNKLRYITEFSSRSSVCLFVCVFLFG